GVRLRADHAVPGRPARWSGDVRARGPRRRTRAVRGAAPEDVTMRVAIVGGGIGGMALALSLRDAGIEHVDVYESTSTVNELGVGINVLPHAVRELTELGL